MTGSFGGRGGHGWTHSEDALGVGLDGRSHGLLVGWDPRLGNDVSPNGTPPLTRVEKRTWKLEQRPDSSVQ